MNNLLKIALLAFLMSFTLSEKALALSSALPACRVIAGTTICAWQAYDSTTGNYLVQASVGTTSDIAATVINLSDTLGSTNNYQPFMFSNNNGDVVVLWEYLDPTTSNAVVAAAMLPSGTTTWSISSISSNAVYSGDNDEQASIDEDGNVFVSWSVYDPVNNEIRIQATTSVISATPTWTTPVTISP